MKKIILILSGAAVLVPIFSAAQYAMPTCSVSLSPNPSSYQYSGTPVTLTWSSQYADEVYINNIGWVGPSGATQVASQATTDYSCYGYSATYGTGSWQSYSLAVTAPSSPSATVTADPASVAVDQTSSVSSSLTGTSNDPLTATELIDNTGRVYSSTTCQPSSGCTEASADTYFTPSAEGTYTFYEKAKTTYYSSWTSYASATVTVTPALECSPQTQYICTGSDGETITASSTDQYCNNTQTPVAVCASPDFCLAGSSTCISPVISFTPTGNRTGHLQLFNNLVHAGNTTSVNWDVSNAQSCTVTGTNGDSWTGLSGSYTSKPIVVQTIYTLFCTAYGSNPDVTETQPVNVTPRFQEQ